MKLSLIFIVLASVFFPAWSEAQNTLSGSCEIERLTFTMIPKKDIDEQAIEYQPLIRLLEQGLGIPVDLIRATSYESVIDAVLSGSVDLAVMGPASYVIAHRQDPGIEAFASLVKAEGEFTPEGSFYYSLLLVPSTYESNSIEDLRSGRVLLTDPSSTSGALIPKHSFAADIGTPFSDFFGAEIYAGGHDKALIALSKKKAEAAFVSSARADELFRRGLIDEKTFKVLWRSSPLHYDPFVFRSGICPSVRGKVIELLTTPSSNLKAHLETQQALRIDRVTHDDYRAIDSILP